MKKFTQILTIFMSSGYKLEMLAESDSKKYNPLLAEIRNTVSNSIGNLNFTYDGKEYIIKENSVVYVEMEIRENH